MNLKPSSFSLKTQGLILISILLFFQLALFYQYGRLLQEADKVAQKESNNKIIIGRTNWMSVLLPVGTLAALQHCFTADKETLNIVQECQKQGLEQISVLRNVNPTPNSLKILDELDKDSQTLFSKWDEMSTASGAQAVRHAEQFLRDPQSKELSKQISKLRSDFLYEHTSKNRLRRNELESQHKETSSFIVYLVLGSIGAAIVLMAAFFSTVTSRLGIVNRNIGHYKAREPLLPPMKGADEIAIVDRSFHEMAESLADAARRKQELMSMVSHDLRSPLTAMKGSISLLANGALGVPSEPMKRELQRAERNAGRLINLINDLLDLEKLEAGQMQIAQGKTALQAVFSNTQESVGYLAEAAHVTLAIEATDIAVWADPDRMVQVMNNLVSNAIKFSPADGVVRIAASKLNSHVEITVSDNGRGVPEKFQEAIFERFKQVSIKDATEKKGTGLGLPICKMIVELHGGKIGVRPNPEGGSQFWFTVPTES